MKEISVVVQTILFLDKQFAAIFRKQKNLLFSLFCYPCKILKLTFEL